MKSSRAYTRLSELMDKYPDEDFTDVFNAIVAHTMIYMSIVQCRPEDIAETFEKIKGYYKPVNGKLEVQQPAIKSISILGKRIPIVLEAITQEPNVSDK